MFDIANYEEARDLEQAIELLTKDPRAKLVAGGTDILLHVREGKLPEAHLVSIHEVAELKGIHLEADSTIVIKPVTTFTQVSSHPLIREHLPFLGEAVNWVGGPQTRHAGTIGGNICNGATSADSAPTLFALNARLQITGPAGIRTIAIQDFYTGPGKVALTQGEILTAIRIAPEDYRGFSGHYIKYAMRNAMDIATLSCSVLCKLGDANLVEDFRLALGVAAPTPIRCLKTETAVKGQTFSKELAATAGKTAVTEVNPRTSWRASKEYRLQLVAELSKRAFREAVAKRRNPA
ncbi:xanthine dehydrogenase subunit XdhB [Acetonema longum]|uniref:Xanthine dehydrogenase subunit XdhB n=1 Tax=Acetonema longum DSM 6540 TaxID=1009370 RepID=F7NDC2_9FIRM|nr:xanthine dehydrogenase subunit XdhB [Acetonema longum]EGO65954.1 xanthine dehydrogenase subunit XdhB [Acetonema longum DSM 6540]